MENLPNNSGKDLVSKVPEKRVERIVTGEIKKRNSFGKMFKDTFKMDIPEDSNGPRDYIISKVILPTVRDGFFDVLIRLLDDWRGGTSGVRRNGIVAGRYNYNQRYSSSRPQSNIAPQTNNYHENTDKYSYDNIIVPTKKDAEDVIASMLDLITAYHVARVADLFDSIGITGNPYTDNNYGWANLDSATYRRVPEGWLLIFPKPMPIED